MIRFGQECGQRWWRLRSWTIRPVFRKLPYAKGFAVGPVMVWRSER